MRDVAWERLGVLSLGKARGTTGRGKVEDEGTGGVLEGTAEVEGSGGEGSGG